MKKLTTSLAIMAGAMIFASCGTTGGSVAQGVGQAILNNAINGNGNTNSNSSSDATNTGTTILGSLLGNLLGTSSTLSQKSIEGTWNYSGANCVFESENLLAKAGGAVAANKIENDINTQLVKVGIKAVHARSHSIATTPTPQTLADAPLAETTPSIQRTKK